MIGSKDGLSALVVSQTSLTSSVSTKPHINLVRGSQGTGYEKQAAGQEPRLTHVDATFPTHEDEVAEKIRATAVPGRPNGDRPAGEEHGVVEDVHPGAQHLKTSRNTIQVKH